jgi:hypothetical protein
LKRNRQDSLNVNAALCNEYQLLHYTVNGRKNFEAINGIVEFMNPTFLATWHGKDIDINKLPTIPCIPTSVLMGQLGVSHIDLWILGMPILLYYSRRFTLYFTAHAYYCIILIRQFHMLTSFNCCVVSAIIVHCIHRHRRGGAICPERDRFLYPKHQHNHHGM